MAAPSPVGTIAKTRSGSGVNTSTITPALPAGITAGEGLLVWAVTNSNGTVSVEASSSSGWVRVGGFSASPVSGALFWKGNANGGAGADDLVLEGAAAAEWSVLARRISGALAATPEISTFALTGGAVNTANPPSLTSAGGVEDLLWVALAAWNQSIAINSYPAGYTETDWQQGAGSTGDSLAWGFKATSGTDTEDPDSFLLNANRNTAGATIVFRPAAVATVVDIGSLVAGGTIQRPEVSTDLAWVDIGATNNNALPSPYDATPLFGKDWRANRPANATGFMRWASDAQVVKFRAQAGQVRSGDPSDRYREEISGSPFPWAASGGDRWSSFAQVPLQLPTDITFNTLCQQFDLGFANPAMKLDDRGDLLQVNIAGDPGTTRNQIAAWEGTRLQTGKLYLHVFRIRASGVGAGELDWWVNGTLVLSLRNVAIGSGASPSMYEKVGTYVDDDATLGMVSDSEVIVLNYESASGTDALLARVSTPLAVPSQISSLYPAGSAPTGTTLIAQPVGISSLSSGGTVQRPSVTAVAQVAPRGLRAAGTIARPQATAATSLAPRGLRSASTLQRPSVAANATVAPRGLRSAGTIQRPQLTVVTGLAPRSLRSTSTISRPDVTVVSGTVDIRSLRSASKISRPGLLASTALTPAGLRSLGTVQRPTVTPAAALAPRGLRSTSAISRPSLTAVASLQPRSLRATSTTQRPAASASTQLQPRSLRAGGTIQRPDAGTGQVSLQPRSLVAGGSIQRPSVAANASVAPRGLRASSAIQRPSVQAGTSAAPRSLRSSTTLERPALVALALLAPRSLRALSTIGRPSVTSGGAIALRSLRSSTRISRPGLIAVTVLEPYDLQAASSIKRPAGYLGEPVVAKDWLTVDLPVEVHALDLKAEARIATLPREAHYVNLRAGKAR